MQRSHGALWAQSRLPFLWLALSLLGGLSASCSIDAGHAGRCGADGGCAESLQCYRGFCVWPDDPYVPPDEAGVPLGMDESPVVQEPDASAPEAGPLAPDAQVEPPDAASPMDAAQPAPPDAGGRPDAALPMSRPDASLPDAMLPPPFGDQPVGAFCDQNSDCESGSCLLLGLFGLCTDACGKEGSSADCPEDSVCKRVQGKARRCLPICTNQAHCPSGWRCVRVPTTDLRACEPNPEDD